MKRQPLPPAGLTWAVLRAIHLLKDKAAGAEIITHFAATAKPVEPARVYVALGRLRGKRMIRVVATERPTKRGRPRKIYALSSAGRAAMEAGEKLYGY